MLTREVRPDTGKEGHHGGEEYWAVMVTLGHWPPINVEVFWFPDPNALQVRASSVGSIFRTASGG